MGVGGLRDGSGGQRSALAVVPWVASTLLSETGSLIVLELTSRQGRSRDVCLSLLSTKITGRHHNT